MAATTEYIELVVGNERIAGTILAPRRRMPGILFVHGWGGSQQRDMLRGRHIAGLGCVCLTFDLRGHEKTLEQKQTINRAQNLEDLLVAYDRLIEHPGVDPERVAVIGTSYGGYLATILTSLRPVRWLAMRVPALYWDEQWQLPKQQLDRPRLMAYRRSRLGPADNRALAACAEFRGDVLIVESEHDEHVPHTTIMNYRSSFIQAHSMTHRIIDGADHALSSERCQEAYTSILTGWISEMIIGDRIGHLS
ncbi:alpha/beta hydrolase family protein [Halopseudomonas pertucinogena]|uniref:Alpha/beta hydrolase n=1 Tax=Halopseudomonas pertucinogena TaxID=86175 RepID=A0ABQ2CK85_9GAMM|nr:alpha/beta hydrolase [Halopseudomonas pertucinogena]GGI92202.1 alpha/beta hydrolase [Halopseudomonas pertucinogena]